MEYLCLLEEYMDSLREQERSEGTIEKYRRDVTSFLAFLNGEEISKTAVLRFKEALQTTHAPSTVNSMLVAVNGFLRFIDRPDCRVGLLKQQHRLFREEEKKLTREEYERLVQSAKKRGDERMELLLETICSTGIRVSEVAYITIEAARSGKTEIRMKGKIRTILLPKKLCKKLLHYGKQKKIASGEIFRTRSGKGISRKQIWAEMKRLCADAGVSPTKVFPHNLRHLFARTFYQVCRDVTKLSDVLGHAKIDTTRIYLMESGVEHAQMLNRLGLVS